jgi:hypothetical protein
MPIESPNLDDRTFEQLVTAARSRIAATSPEWTDLSPGDPGMTLVEVFAYLAETMIYRLNRVPNKLYVEFLRLIGVRLGPPAAAAAKLRFTRERNAPPTEIRIPRGTRVTTGTLATGNEPPIFATVADAAIPKGTESVEVLALNAETVTAELAGRATGRPGTWFALARPPAIAPTGDPLDLLVGVEIQPSELPEGEPAIEWEGKTYRIWREVENFSDVPHDAPVFVADRSAGIVVFAPAARMTEPSNGGSNGEPGALRALAAVPVGGREVRLWYRRGGGIAGNVAADSLTTMRDAIPGVTVTNPTPGTGGREPETVENALIRGPQELRSLARAVTARDYQLVAERSSGAVARARAFTQAELWSYATPGTVEVVIVPALPGEGQEENVTADQLRALETEEARSRVISAIEERRPLGSSSVVNWARYKTVRVKATIAVRREEDLGRVRDRVNRRIRLTVNPLDTELNVGGWPFGQPLFASAVYKIVLSEPGVRYARGIKLIVDEVPNVDIEDLAADAFQQDTWYAGSGSYLFRTLNDGAGWERMATFEGERVTVVRAHPGKPGYVAAVATLTGSEGSRLHVSRDGGNTWDFTREFGFMVEDVAWSLREGLPLLFMATGGGLYQLTTEPEADVVQLLVESTNQKLPFYSVVATQEVKGEITVAAVAQGSAGVYLSSDAGSTGTFRKIGLNGEDVRVLAVQYDGPRSFLWAGTAAPGGDQPGKGTFRRELLGREDPTEGWVPFNQGWATVGAGSCWALAFAGSIVFAATQQKGILRLDLGAATPAWIAPTVGSGLPLRDPGRFHPTRAVAANREGNRVMVGGPVGVYRSILRKDQPPWSATAEPKYESTSESSFPEEVTLPPTWLFTCSDNEIEVLADAPE